MIHYFPEDYIFQQTDGFTDPFRYAPHPAVQEAARLVINEIVSNPDMSTAFQEGKMLGILVCVTPSQQLGYLAAFSGNVAGQSNIQGFVPPIYDLLEPNGYFKQREAEISAINKEIKALSESSELAQAHELYKKLAASRDKEVESFRCRIAENKKQREVVRSQSNDPSILSALIKESQHEKAELKRLKASWEEHIRAVKLGMDAIKRRIEYLSSVRAEMSDQLQEWIFRQYKVHNLLGEEASIADIFNSIGLVPPGGTGECAAPKLLEYAYKQKLTPLAMGEFWYGDSPETAVRTHGHFYPSCTSKCGPLLGFMLKGLEINSSEIDPVSSQPIIIFEDDTIIVAEKPSGMPSVPGLDGRKSLLEWLKEREKDVYSVHRLDMDTSGVMIYAKTENAAAELQHQFEEYTIRKTYIARLCATESSAIDISDNQIFESGFINLSLSPDYDERPRQKVDNQHGKESYTEYEIGHTYPDGRSDIMLYPKTGRTHQLRVHCAHIKGLGRPIIGDLLYGGASIAQNINSRLHLHALSISFKHPITRELLSFTSKELIY